MSKKCQFNECQLPENNNRYYWQIAYVVIGFFVLFRSEKDFNFFQTFLFISPIFFDILYSGANTRLLRILRLTFGILNALVLIGCILGFAGIVEDTGESFVFVQESISLGGMYIKKKMLANLLWVNIFIPVIYLISSPCKAGNLMTQFAKAATANRLTKGGVK